MQIVVALIAGALFGAGLTIAQMLDPRKILDFLDVAAIGRGTWDPTLLMVFIGALPIVFVAYAAQRRMSRPVLDTAFSIPTSTTVDGRLVGGSVLFGIGWGLVGVCPGPAIAALALAGPQLTGIVAFIAAMLAGMLLSRLVSAPRGDADAAAGIA